MLAKEKPEYYDGVIGTGQMVAFKETEEWYYYKAIEILECEGNTKKSEKLRETLINSVMYLKVVNSHPIVLILQFFLEDHGVILRKRFSLTVSLVIISGLRVLRTGINLLHIKPPFCRIQFNR